MWAETYAAFGRERISMKIKSDNPEDDGLFSPQPNRPTILCFVAYYLPGYRSGGPVRTIANFVDHLGDGFDIRIVTRDRDALDTEPYPSVEVDAWNTVGKAQVFYASGKTLNLRGIAKLLRETPRNVLYLNSFFAFGFTGLPLLARRLGIAPRNPCVIAPRGEFSQGAIALKAWKKRPYMRVTRMMGLYSGLHWQASSEFEVSDIQRELDVPAEDISVAPNLPPAIEPAGLGEASHQPRGDGPLRLVFLSRISPKKNLDFLLEVLTEVNFDVVLDIYGVVDDEDHWGYCKTLIAQLPASVEVNYEGVIPHSKVSRVIANYDLFVLPTRGENYGHAIAEALTQGTPVLISDQTPWRDLERYGAGWDLPLDKKYRFLDAITRVNSMERADYLALRQSTADYARRKLSDPSIAESNRCLFDHLLGVER